jgi:uroporphyrinogen decarboxylase
MLPAVKEASGDIISVDWRLELAEADRQLGPEVALQGNLDPVVLLAPIAEIKKQAARILESVKGRQGYIFNLGHGILPQTPVDHVAALIDFVHEYEAR